MKRLIITLVFLLFTTTLFAQSSAYSPQYFKRVSGVISPIISTDTISANITGTITGNITGNSGTVTNGAYITVANIFTQTQTISNAAPILTLTDTTASAKSLNIKLDANLVDFYESSGSAGLFQLDLANTQATFGTDNLFIKSLATDTIASRHHITLKSSSGTAYFAMGLDGNGDLAIDKVPTTRTNIMTIRAGGDIVMPGLKSTSGTRFLCISTTGVVTSSASACSGT